VKRRSALVVAIAMLGTAVVSNGGTATAETKTTYDPSREGSSAAGDQPGDAPIFGGNHGYTNQLFKAVRDDYRQPRLVKMGCGGDSALGMIVGDVGCAPLIYQHDSQPDEAVAFRTAHLGDVPFNTNDWANRPANLANTCCSSRVVTAVIPDFPLSWMTHTGPIVIEPRTPLLGLAQMTWYLQECPDGSYAYIAGSAGAIVTGVAVSP
jgi:hypothetical protein